MNLHQPVIQTDDLRKVTDNILREVGLSIKDSGGETTFAGKEPVRKTTMKAGAAPAIHVDLRKAWIEQSPWQLEVAPYTLINGAHKMFNFGVYVVLNPQCPTRDGRFMIMGPLYPSQERKIVRLLNCGPDESQLRAAIIRRDALEMEAAGEALQVPFQMIRTREEWDASEQGRIHAETPLISIEKIGESDPIGVKAALLRRAKEGGSYRVDVSLAQCCSFIMSLGLNDNEVFEDLENLGPEHQTMKLNLITGMTAFEKLPRPVRRLKCRRPRSLGMLLCCISPTRANQNGFRRVDAKHWPHASVADLSPASRVQEIRNTN